MLENVSLGTPENSAIQKLSIIIIIITDHNDCVALVWQATFSKGRNSSITTALTRGNSSFFPLSLTSWRLFCLSHQFCSVALVKRGLFLYYKKQAHVILFLIKVHEHS